MKKLGGEAEGTLIGRRRARMFPVAVIVAMLLAPATATCPAVTTQEVTDALQHVGEVGPWSVDGPVQPYPNVPYYECHYLSGLPKLNRQVFVQVRATERNEQTAIKPFVTQISRTALVPPSPVPHLGDEAWFFIDAEGVGQLNVRTGPAVVHVAVDLRTKGTGDQMKKLEAAETVAAHAIRRLKTGDITVTKK
jgi:hypothetical protein